MNALIKTIFLLLITFLVALSASHNVIHVNNISISFICFIITFLIHYIVFIPSFIFRTERFFDITGSITFLSVISYIFYNRNIEDLNYSGIILLLFIGIWTLRLGLFLFYRVIKDGKDKRFDELKINFLKFMTVWTMSGAWVFITASPAIAALSSNKINDNLFFIIIGAILWIFGFIIEFISDKQKRKFKQSNKDGYITSGLWAYSRHPNYVGEIMLWTGIAIISFPSLEGFQLITLISPIFVYLLLTKISGLNILEENADKKWGNEKEYKEYKNNTPILFPFKK